MLLQKLANGWHLLGDSDALARLQSARQEHEALQQAQQFLQAKGQWLDELAAQAHLLREDPRGQEALQQAVEASEQQLTGIRRQVFALDELLARSSHFAYQDAEAMLGQTSEISDRLKAKLEEAELARRQLT